ncbi:hypothetical protein [Micromonospora sp. NPDC048843]|uniref:hypothetical protein n=1 Tax=Micromonospora sp. NPDC048843 TaxID=3155389 RepID=UPI0033F5DACA
MTATSERDDLRAVALTPARTAAVVCARSMAVVERPIADTLQHLKQLWHVLVRLGTPYGT